jgi:hypothetical protein
MIDKNRCEECANRLISNNYHRSKEHRVELLCDGCYINKLISSGTIIHKRIQCNNVINDNKELLSEMETRIISNSNCIDNIMETLKISNDARLRNNNERDKRLNMIDRRLELAMKYAKIPISLWKQSDKNAQIEVL